MAVITVEQAARLEFEPVITETVMSASVFRDHSSAAYTTFKIAQRLLAFGPDDLAATLLKINPEDPLETLNEIRNTAEWLRGLVDIFDCVDARALCALSRHAVADKVTGGIQ